MTRPTTPPPIPPMPDLPQALCAQIGTADEVWFPKAGDNGVVGKRICARCPEIEPCLKYALENDVVGLWAGTGSEERRRWRRERGLRAIPLSTATAVDTISEGAKNRTVREVTVAPIVHGTQRGYSAHTRRNEKPCAECNAAERAYRAELRQRKAA